MAKNSPVQWRKFNFFEREVVEDGFERLFSNSNITIALAEGGMLLFGDSNGLIVVTDRDLMSVDKRVKAFRSDVYGIAYLFDLSRRQYIIAIGDDKQNVTGGNNSILNPPNYMIKCYAVGSNTEISRPIQTISVNQSFYPSGAIITSFSVMKDGSQVAIAFSSGTILCYTGSFLNEGNNLASKITPQILNQNHIYPVSGLYFCESVASKPDDRKIRLFAVFDTEIKQEISNESIENKDLLGGIVVYDTSIIPAPNVGYIPSEKRKLPNILDDRGASPGCSSLMNETNELVVGRMEGIFSYSVDDRGGAAGFEGPKQSVITVGRHILVASVEEKTQRTNITIYDLRNKFISMSSSLPNGDNVKEVLHDSGTAYVITENKSLIRFKEKETTVKIELLKKKFLFQLAISLAAEEQCEVSEIMKLNKEYGDHLYTKNDYDGAMTQYCYTIGFLQSSYVIRRFLDPRRIENLILYLEKLHEKGVATRDHTNLLLTIYTKMKDESKVTAFCNNSCKLATTTAPKLLNEIPGNVDVDGVVSILTKSGFVEQALKVALEYNQHSAYLDILMSKDPPDVVASLGYISSLIFTPSLTTQTMKELLDKYARKLLVMLPNEVTSLFIILCSGNYDSLKLKVITTTSNQLSVSPYLTPLNIEDLLPCYVNNEKYFLLLMDGLYEGNFTHKAFTPKVMNTLLELYLDEYNTLKSENNNDYRALDEKIMSLLDIVCSGLEYDVSQALLLTRQFQYSVGEKFLLDKQQSTELLLRMYTESNDDNSIFKILRKEDRKDSEFYIQILTYFVKKVDTGSSDMDDDEKWENVTKVLDIIIEKDTVLAPMQILSVLAMNKDLPLHIISSYMKSTLLECNNTISKLETSVRSMRNTIETIRQEDNVRKELGGNRFKKNLTKSKDSKNHSDSLDEEDEEDLLHNSKIQEEENIREQKKWENIKKDLMERSSEHEAFYSELERSNDGFNTVASYFGKVIIGPQ